MKRKVYSLRSLIGYLFLIFTLLSTSCQKKDTLYVEPSRLSELKEFSLSEAKEFVQSSAVPLTLSGIPGVSNLTKSTSGLLPGALKVQWEAYFAYEDDRSSIYELPIDLGTSLQGSLVQKNGNVPTSLRENVKVESRLVVQKFKKDGFVRRFIFMAIGVSSAEKTNADEPTPFHYTGDRRKFEGYLVFADEQGAIQEAFYYKNGKRAAVSVAYHLLGSDSLKGTYKGYSLFTRIQTKNDLPWSGDGYECYYCGCLIEDGDGCHCGGGVFVVDDPIYCNTCGFYKGQCRCCSVCRWYPCECNDRGGGDGPGATRCPDCFSEHCNGECRHVPDEPPGSGVKSYMLSLIASGNGSVTGGGTYESNSMVYFSAQANTGYKFIAWVELSSNILLSYNASYNVLLNSDKAFKAVFQSDTSKCAKLRELYKDSNLAATISILRNEHVLQPNKEHAVMMSSTGVRTTQAGEENKVAFNPVPGTQYTYRLHTHPSEGYCVSLGDLTTLHYMGKNNYIHDASSFLYGVVTEGYSCILKIKDPAKFNAFTALSKDQLEQFFHTEIVGEQGADLRIQTKIYLTSKFLSTYGIGMAISETITAYDDKKIEEWRWVNSTATSFNTMNCY